MGYSPWDCEKLDMTKATGHRHSSKKMILGKIEFTWRKQSFLSLAEEGQSASGTALRLKGMCCRTVGKFIQNHSVESLAPV